MLRVCTYLDRSTIHGIGLFAGQNISKGMIVWTYVPAIDREIDVMERFAVDMAGHQLDKNFLKKYAFHDLQTDKYILPGDDDRFINHSEDPNTGPIENGDMIAIKDIKFGQELTANYYEIDTLANDKLLKLR